MGSPTATVFADELTGRAVGPGLMKTPIMGDWDEHPTQARLPVSTRVTPQGHGWVRPCVFPVLRAGAEWSRDPRLLSRDAVTRQGHAVPAAGEPFPGVGVGGCR